MKNSPQQSIISNIHRLQGQLAGIERMVKEKRTCKDVVTQLLAAKSALDAIASLIMQDSTSVCIRSGSKKDLKKLKETLDSVFTYI